MKKGQAAQEDYRAVVMLCREKSRRAKAQLELSLASVVKNNKNAFIDTSTAKGGLQRISILYWM